MSSPQSAQRPRRDICARCHLALPDGSVCEWCGHDPDDAAMVAVLAARHEELLEYRHDSTARKAWLAQTGEHPFMSCPACGQWGRYGLCEWCDFDATDEVAISAVHAHRNATRLPRNGTPDAADAERLVHCFACGQLTRPPICTWCDHELPATLYEDVPIPPVAGVRLHGRKAYALARGLVRLDFVEQVRLIAHLFRWILLGAVVGVLAGLSSAAFLQSLTWATNLRVDHGWLLFLLPVGGLVVGLAYHHFGGRASGGNALIIDEIHDPSAWVPRRMAPLVFIGTVITHVSGGSAGREGTAIQMSGSLTDGFSRLVRIDPRSSVDADRRVGRRVRCRVRCSDRGLRVRVGGAGGGPDALRRVDACVVCVVGWRSRGARCWSEAHVAAGTRRDPCHRGARRQGCVAGLAFGLASILFSELVHGINRAFVTIVRWAPARPLIGGVGVIGLTYLVGTRDYLGLSVPLITKATAGGAGIVAGAFALKLLFTALTLGAGFQGGEVTPLFVIGATLGVTMGRLLNVPIPLMAAIGFVAVFAGAANTPLACTIMGVELFGGGGVVVFSIACVVSYIFSSRRGIYGTQRIDSPKGPADLIDGHHVGMTLNHLVHRRRHWLPARTDRPTNGVKGNDAR